jgi:hypothetical protein
VAKIHIYILHQAGDTGARNTAHPRSEDSNINNKIIIIIIIIIIGNSLEMRRQIINIYKDIINNFMELSPSLEAASHATTEELPNILLNPKIYYRDHKSPPLGFGLRKRYLL